MNSGLRRIGDVEDVDVGELGVVGGHEVRARAVLPDEDAVVGVRRPRPGPGPSELSGGLVAGALHERHRVGRIGDVVEVEAADVLSAGAQSSSATFEP